MSLTELTKTKWSRSFLNETKRYVLNKNMTYYDRFYYAYACLSTPVWISIHRVQLYQKLSTRARSAASTSIMLMYGARF
jgi:hypothetical protein